MYGCHSLDYMIYETTLADYSEGLSFQVWGNKQLCWRSSCGKKKKKKQELNGAKGDYEWLLEPKCGL